MTGPDLSVVMLAYGAEEWLVDAVDAVLASTGPSLEVVLVDNGCTSDAVAVVTDRPGVRVLRPGRNLGFTGGVNLGVAESRAPVVALVNSDAVVAPDCLARLVRRAADPAVGIVGALVVLADDPGTVNSAGNPLHVLGLSWAGRMGEPVSAIPERASVASASGACLAMRREVWDLLGGFPAELFAYLEDLDLGWRCWQQGLRVEVLAAARARHHYEFGRSPLKMYLLERNRLLLVLTTYSRRMLLALALPLVAFELAILAVSWRQGWARQKLRGWAWVAGHLGWVRRRRRAVQAARQVPMRSLVPLLTTSFDAAQMPLPAAALPLQTVLQGYWAVVRRFV
ncbi:glycosyltransferase family 2 protein [Georgenia sp. TF02-10]|uniref:glycosyltransferase family 2 protein n=1 Tax=Georgenia sp. TF02-10 TaxID=2917725 RepID=UPI001FA7F977|nr:glycosyltransferase family 2 protein [Georgenia sp. TF02-10]UNX55763.1 glycosyltransferase family 2 protein [Georgenia sp. TF02-10]